MPFPEGVNLKHKHSNWNYPPPSVSWPKMNRNTWFPSERHFIAKPKATNHGGLQDAMSASQLTTQSTPYTFFQRTSERRQTKTNTSQDFAEPRISNKPKLSKPGPTPLEHLSCSISEHPDLIDLLLWSMTRDTEPQHVFSKQGVGRPKSVFFFFFCHQGMMVLISFNQNGPGCKEFSVSVLPLMRCFCMDLLLCMSSWVWLNLGCSRSEK